ncbi:egalitarian protein homolog [Ischnura elegans]|uniref:egalitarian protein homolog n=1 Tax=Ischnura elegans TaxID=197161 RepID=UPI001ED878C8|nr:egalitarian protein homolog [Ischnura elegans]
MDSSEYELVRNMTLLFFFERLMDKGGPRTLHDLSCQFGAKGFTREMRQIAGGSQSGLKKFLGQHPSLFYICGDYVRVNTFEHPGPDVNGSGDGDAPVDSNRVGGRRRDYAKEAVDYFSEKLLQYGVGTQVPIKSLLGHRSQASPEVRHISGQHVREFRDFLLRHPQDFVVREGPDGIGETVSLRIHEGSTAPPVPFKEHEEVKVDPEVTRRLLEFAAAAVTSGTRGGQGPITLERLFRSVSSALPPDPTLQNVLKTPQDLSTFLRIHSDAFHLHANLVTLVPGATVGKTSNDSQSSRVSSTPESQPTPVSTPPLSVSPRQSLTSPQPLNRLSNPGDLQARSLKQRVNSLVMKTIADNSEKDRGNLHGGSNNCAPQSGVPHLTTNSIPSTEAWKARVTHATRIISTVKECLQVVEDIMRGSYLGSSTILPVDISESQNDSPWTPMPVVSFDCEGVNLGARGCLSLFQIGLPSGHVIIFDLLTCPALVTSGGLQTLLESEKVVKVIHDCRNDSINLFNQFGITLQNVFDTQAAHAILQLQETGRPVHKAKNLSLNALCLAHGAVPNPMKESLKGIYRRDQRYWNRRPLTRDMMIYAAADVLSLVPHVYTSMQRLIQSKWIPLLQELCEEQILMNIRPAEVKMRKKQRKVEAEVADLRQKLDSSSAMPSASSSSVIVLSNREIRLLRYLDLTEEEKERLKGSYKVARKLEKLESLGVDRDSKSGDGDEDDDDDDDEDGSEDGGGNGGGTANGDSEYPSLDSMASGSGKGSPDSLPLLKGGTTLTESMQLVDEILSDNRLDRTERIERLEAVLSSAVSLTVGPGNGTDSPSSPILTNSSALQMCHCSCHLNGEKEKEKSLDEKALTKRDCVSASSQTLSTGDIVITRIYFTEEEREKREKGLAASKK